MAMALIELKEDHSHNNFKPNFEPIYLPASDPKIAVKNIQIGSTLKIVSNRHHKNSIKCYNRRMTSIQLVNKNKSLIQAFKTFKKRYLNMGKKLDLGKFLPEVVYRTMRLEGEQITRKEEIGR